MDFSRMFGVDTRALPQQIESIIATLQSLHHDLRSLVDQLTPAPESAPAVIGLLSTANTSETLNAAYIVDSLVFSANQTGLYGVKIGLLTWPFYHTANTVSTIRFGSKGLPFGRGQTLAIDTTSTPSATFYALLFGSPQ